jgi:hypothetical protein
MGVGRSQRRAFTLFPYRRVPVATAGSPDSSLTLFPIQLSVIILQREKKISVCTDDLYDRRKYSFLSSLPGEIASLIYSVRRKVRTNVYPFF